MAQRTYLKALNWAFLFLEERDKEREAARFLLSGLQHWSNTQLVLNYQSAMPEVLWQQYQAAIQAFAQDQPAQYILGYADFYGREFKVTPATLIPRPETEELVEWVLTTHPDVNQTLKVLDVGTGSGAIANTLALERPNWQVTAVDISTDALNVAQENAQQLQSGVHFEQGDFLAPVNGQQFDIIVSNPPYIADSERTVMDASVLEYEPDIALFAAQDGLDFYERFAKEVLPYFEPTAELFLEFGYQQKPNIEKLFTSYSSDISLEFKKDLANWPRMMRGSYNFTNNLI